MALGYGLEFGDRSIVYLRLDWDRHMRLLIYNLVLALAWQVATAHAQGAGRWEAKGSDALIGVSTDPNSPSPAAVKLLVIGYSPKTGCRAVASFLFMKGAALGPELRRRTGKSDKNRMSVIVNQREFSAETIMFEYANGIELAMAASNELIHALERSNVSVVVKVGSTEHLKIASASNFFDAHQRARASCKTG
jgi:hypothetical protein